MNLTVINQCQPNIRYIIHDTTPEYNVPNFNLNNKKFVIGNEHSNNLHICTEAELKKYFENNNELYDIVIFSDFLRYKIRKKISSLSNEINEQNIDISDISRCII